MTRVKKALIEKLYGHTTIRPDRFVHLGVGQRPPWHRRALWWVKDHQGELWLAAAIVTVLTIAVAAGVEEERRWQAFAAEHQCQVVEVAKARTNTGVGYGVTSGGQGGTIVTTTYEPERRGYRCDDGVVYWR